MEKKYTNYGCKKQKKIYRHLKIVLTLKIMTGHIKMGRKKHLDLLKDFKKNLSEKIFIKKMFLFGSGANGKPKRWSDFDLIVVSKEFNNQKSIKRGIGFYKYWNLDYPVDFLCYTPKEFNKLKSQVSIVREAIKNGIEIK